MGGLAPGQLKSRRGWHSSPRRLHYRFSFFDRVSRTHCGKNSINFAGMAHSHRHRLAAAWPSLVRQIGPVLRRRRHRLWLSDQTVLRRSNTYGAVGSGAEYATVLLSRIYTQLPLSKATVLAAYTIFLVKEFVEGCGKNTEVVVLDGGQARMLADSDIALMEYHFNHALKLDSMMVHYIIGRRVPDENAALNNLTGYLKSLRTSLEENPNITAEIRGWDIDWDE